MKIKGRVVGFVVYEVYDGVSGSGCSTPMSIGREKLHRYLWHSESFGVIFHTRRKAYMAIAANSAYLLSESWFVGRVLPDLRTKMLREPV